MSDEVVVRTKDELKMAVKNKVKKIIVEGDLAKYVERIYKLKKVSKARLIILSSLVASIPVTRGISAIPALLIAKATGLEVAIILAVLFLGLALVLIILREYKKAEIEIGIGGEVIRITIERKD